MISSLVSSQPDTTIHRSLRPACATTGFAKALHSVLEANGGAGSCSLEPGQEQFQLELRRALYATDFTGVSGQVAVSQCSTANFDSPDLLSSSTETCGDRTALPVQVKGYGLYEGVLEWKHIAVVDDVTMTLTLEGEFIFLGNSSVVPVDYVPFAVCALGYWRNSLKECIPCDLGTYTDEHDQLVCTECTAGECCFACVFITHYRLARIHMSLNANCYLVR